MTLSEQATIIVEAMKRDIIQPEDVVEWAENSIATMDKSSVPPPWLVDLAVLRSRYIIDYICIAREHEAGSVTPEQQIQMAILSHRASERPMGETLSKLFQLYISQRFDAEQHPIYTRILDALLEWDTQEDPAVISPELQVKFDALFDEVIAHAGELARILPAWGKLVAKR